MERIRVPVLVNGQTFEFPVCRRPLNVGLDRPIQYYWIDHDLLRETRSNQSTNLCDRIVEFWREAMIEAGAFQDSAQLEHYLFAKCHRVLSGNRGMQRVFRDAHAGHHTDERDAPVGAIELSDEIRGHIRAVVNSRELNALRGEFATVLEWQPLPETDRGLFNRFLDNWIGVGLRKLTENAETGVEEFVETVKHWDRLLGRSGRTDQSIRTFLNRFAYECKCSFFRCYTQVWSRLIAELLQNHQLNETSCRFLRLWHLQNLPTETIDARGRRLIEPDVFFGHVLALHPLSGHFMQDSALLNVAGHFFGTDAWNAVFERNESDRPEYWNLVEAILLAGHAYRANLNRQDAARGSRQATLPDDYLAPSTEELQSEEPDQEELLCRVAHSLNFRCAHCDFALVRFAYRASSSAEQALLTGQCSACNTEHSRLITFEEFAAAVRPPQDAESDCD